MRREPNAVSLVDELLSNASMSIDALTVDALGENSTISNGSIG